MSSFNTEINRDDSVAATTESRGAVTEFIYFAGGSWLGRKDGRENFHGSLEEIVSAMAPGSTPEEVEAAVRVLHCIVGPKERGW